MQLVMFKHAPAVVDVDYEERRVLSKLAPEKCHRRPFKKHAPSEMLTKIADCVRPDVSLVV